MMAFCPEHPKWDQNPKFTPLSETTSIPTLFICRVPPSPSRERWSQPEVQLYLSVYKRVWNELVMSYVYIRFLYFCNRLIPKIYSSTTWSWGALFLELNDAFYHYFMIVITWTFLYRLAFSSCFWLRLSRSWRLLREILCTIRTPDGKRTPPVWLKLHVDLFQGPGLGCLKTVNLTIC